MTYKQINAKEFETEIQTRVVVQFTATWCGPCKTLSKTIESNVDSLTTPIVKLDLDEAADIAREHGVKSVPTLIMFDGGKEVKRTVGSKTIDKILEFIA